MIFPSGLQRRVISVTTTSHSTQGLKTGTGDFNRLMFSLTMAILFHLKTFDNNDTKNSLCDKNNISFREDDILNDLSENGEASSGYALV